MMIPQMMRGRGSAAVLLCCVKCARNSVFSGLCDPPPHPIPPNPYHKKLFSSKILPDTYFRIMDISLLSVNEFENFFFLLKGNLICDKKNAVWFELGLFVFKKCRSLKVSVNFSNKFHILNVTLTLCLNDLCIVFVFLYQWVEKSFLNLTICILIHIVQFYL